MAFNEALRKSVLRKVGKRPKTASEIGAPLGYSGRGVGKVLAELVKQKLVEKIDSRPPKYRKR